jgi:hypothetical protein
MTRADDSVPSKKILSASTAAAATIISGVTSISPLAGGSLSRGIMGSFVLPSCVVPLGLGANHHLRSGRQRDLPGAVVHVGAGRHVLDRCEKSGCAATRDSGA